MINLAKSNEDIITEKLFENKAVSVENIIGNYLIYQLNEFGDSNSDKRRKVENILKELVRDTAKDQKKKIDIKRYLKITDNELQELLDILVKKRLIRHLDEEKYEIIHNFLVLKVEKMIKYDERPLRSAISSLRTKTLNYEYIHSFLDTAELMKIYSLKESINPSIQEKEMLIYSYLAGNGPAWWWFREDKDVLRTFIKKGLSNRSEKVRRAALLVFVKLVAHDDLPTVREMLKDPDSYVREAALSAFVKLGTHDNLPSIKEMLKDPDSYVREKALSAFVKLVTHDDFPAIKEMLKDLDSNVKKVALSAFVKLVTHDDLPTVKEMLKDSDSNVKKVALSAFEQLGTQDDLSVVKEMLKDPNSYVREVALSVLVKLGTHDDLPTVKEMFKDPDSYVREAALSAFMKLVTHDDLPVVKEMLKDPDLNVKRAALSAFEQLVTHDDLPDVRMMLKDPDMNLKKMVLSAFELFGTEDDLKDIVNEFLNDENSNEAALRCIISLDEKFYSPLREVFSSIISDNPMIS